MNEEDQFSDFVVPTGPRHPTSPPRGFAPWHLPRKQWIRMFQWTDEVERLLGDIHFPDGSAILRYLGMPGEDMLDIRMLRTLCEKLRIQLHYTGLVASSGSRADDLQLNISDAEIRRSPHVHEGSRILRDRFETICLRTVSKERVQAAGPFHVINADLTGHVALRTSGAGGGTYIEAIGEILRQQVRSRDPWLLFLTTRVDPSRVHTANIAALVRALQNNIAANPTFGSTLSELLLVAGDQLVAVLQQPGTLPLQQFKDLFCIGFAKWLLSYAYGAVPQLSVRMLDSCYYSVVSGRPDMLSLAFIFEPLHQPPRDQFGLLPDQPTVALPNELEMAMAMLQRTRGLIDLDSLMASDAGLFEQMTFETEDLLRQANYPVDDPEKGYRAWLNTARHSPAILANASAPGSAP